MKTLEDIDRYLLGLEGQPLVEIVGQDADGKTITRPIVAKKLLANVLARVQSTSPASAIRLALALGAAGSSLEVEETEDLPLMKAAVLADTGIGSLNNIAKFRLLEMLEGVNGTGPNRAERRRRGKLS